ncbi:MAG: hypothetical protein ACKOC9_06435, partial [Alphaproteobacteria bacterium]
MREVIDDLAGDFACIKILRAPGGEALQRAGHFGMYQLVAHFMQLAGLPSGMQRVTKTKACAALYLN